MKVFAGQRVTGGEIIVRQRGTRFKPGPGTASAATTRSSPRAAGMVEFNTGRKGRLISVVSPD